MAFKSPGIYYKEVDNTEYTNPAAEINTTVAIVGFAKKGPIGEPIEITSYNSFKSIFGEPITGTYAGLGVRSVLSAGGTVLFVRVADETTASKSNVVIRNGVKEVKGSLIFNHNKTITSSYSNYKNNEVYSGTFSIKDDKGNAKANTTKTVYLRAPASGNFAISDIQKQLQDQLDDDTNAYEEFSINAKPLTYAPRLFNIEVGVEGSNPNTYGPFVFNPILEDSTNQTEELNFESVFKALNNINGYNTKLLISNKKLENFDNEYYLPIEKDTDVKLVFNIIDGSKETEVTIKLADGDIEEIETSTYIKVSTLVSRINSGLKEYDIGCNYFVKESENESILYLFVCAEGTKQLMPGKTTGTNLGTSLLTIVPTITLDQNSLVLNNDGGSESVTLDVSYADNNGFLDGLDDDFEQRDNILSDITNLKTLNNEKSYDEILNIYINGASISDNIIVDGVSVETEGDTVIFNNSGILKNAIVAKADRNINDGLKNKFDLKVEDLNFENKPEIVKANVDGTIEIENVVLNLSLNLKISENETAQTSTTYNKNSVSIDYNESFVFAKEDEESYKKLTDEDYQKSILFDFDAKEETVINEGVSTTSYDCFTKEIDREELDSSIAFDDPVEFNKNTVGIVIKDNNTFTAGRTIRVEEWNYEEETTEPATESSTYSLNYKFGDVLNINSARTVSSEKGLEGCYEITTDAKKRLCIENKNTEANGYIAPTLESGSLLDFLSNNEGILTQKEFEEKGFREGNEFALITKNGVSAVAADKSDLIVFTAKEFGSGTSTIGIEIYTVKSPLDETETHYIELFVDGLRKESWEDVSYDKTAENYFANLINADPDEGGSNYVSVIVREPKEKENTIIDVPDTSKLSSTGIIYLGKPVGEEVSFESVKDITIDDYDQYDYYLGNDGVPSYQEETTKYINLFANAMNVETSGLSNKDLYSWHILITPDDHQNQDIQDEAINLVEFMEDAIYIVDPPRGLSRDAVINWHNGKTEERITPLESNYACTYWPWVKVYNSIDSKYQYIMPSIIMAAQFCRVDANYAPWYAPAGETNGYCSTALDLEVNSKDNRYPNKTDRDALYLNLNRVNPFLKLRNGNILAFGEKTCQRKNSTLTKIHTRRMLVALKKDLNSVIKGFIFQPTMSENISTIRSNVITIMERYKSGGGVASYNVICDDTNNTTETLQQDILNVAVSCVPTGCIEQVEITLTLNKNAE